MDVVRIPLAEARRMGGRKLDAATVSTLKDSMAAIGLLSPIVVTHAVRNDGPTKVDTYSIVAGRHRVEAARELGWTEIDAIVLELDAQHAELCEIDENLARAELSPAQRAQAQARRKEIMVELGLVSRPGKGGDRRSNDNLSLGSYASQAADALGVDKRTVEREVARGEKIAPDVLAEVQGTKLDTGATLDALAAMPMAEQPARLAELRKPVRPAPDPLNDLEVFETWLNAMMRVWNKGSPAFRQAFLDRVDTPVFDKGRAA